MPTASNAIRVARVLLAHSRLGVVMVGDLPPHALESALQPLRDGIARGPWPGRQMLFVPLSAAGALHQQASQLGGRTGVQVSIAPQAVKPSDAWTRSATPGTVCAATPAAAMPAVPTPRRAAGARPDRVPRAGAPAGAAARCRCRCNRCPPTPPAAAAPASANNPWQAYVRQCIDITGMISCCVFELGTQRTLAHAGARPARPRWPRRVRRCIEAANTAAKAMGLPVATPDPSITLSGHHLIVRAIAGHPGLALHAVLDSHATNLMLVRMKLQRLDQDSASAA